MNTRLHCKAQAPSIANWQANFASWRGAASSPDRGEAYCSSRYPSIAELSTSTARPRDRAGHDRRNARMDDVSAGRAFGVGDVAAGAQTLTIWRVMTLDLTDEETGRLIVHHGVPPRRRGKVGSRQ